MNQLFLLLGLTILYYVVLYWFDQRGRKAFKAKQQALMAQTAELPIIETTVKPPVDLLGATTNLANTDFLAKRKEMISPTTGLSKELKGGMQQLATELESEIAPKIKKDDLQATLKSTLDITSIKEAETTDFINSITKRPKR